MDGWMDIQPAVGSCETSSSFVIMKINFSKKKSIIAREDHEHVRMDEWMDEWFPKSLIIKVNRKKQRCVASMAVKARGMLNKHGQAC